MRPDQVGLILATLIMLGGISCQCVTHGSPSSDPAIDHVRNFGVVQEGVLYRGADPDGLALNQLKTSRYKIKTIVNLNVIDDDKMSIDSQDLQYFHVPMYPVPYVSIKADQQIKRFLEIVRDPENQPVFVHDTRGATRTGEAVGAYEILDLHKPIEDVELELNEHHYCKAIYPQIVRNLRKLAAPAEAPPVTVVPVETSTDATQPAPVTAPATQRTP